MKKEMKKAEKKEIKGMKKASDFANKKVPAKKDLNKAMKKGCKY